MKGVFKHKNIIVLSILLVAGWLAAVALTPKRLSPLVAESFDLQTIIPTEFSEWKLDRRVRPIQPIEKGSLADRIYDQTVSRGYRNAAGDLIMVVVAYGRNQSDALQLHLPEICYAANGFDVSGPDRVDLVFRQRDNLALPLLKVKTKNGGRFEPISYWTRVGDALPVGNFSRQLHKISFGLRGGIPDGILVRVSSIDHDFESAFKSHEVFIRRFLEAIPRKYLPLFIGSLAEEISPDSMLVTSQDEAAVPLEN